MLHCSLACHCRLSVLVHAHYSGAPARASRARDRAPYSWNMVNLFSLGCHVIDRAYVRTYASTDCTGRVGETIKRKGGVSQACLSKSWPRLFKRWIALSNV